MLSFVLREHETGEVMVCYAHAFWSFNFMDEWDAVRADVMICFLGSFLFFFS